MKKILFFLLAMGSLCAAPQAVVFDFGGVITGVPKREGVVRFLLDFLQIERAEFEELDATKKESGKGDVEYWASVIQEKGLLLPDEWERKFYAVVKESIMPDPEMSALVEELREAQVVVGLLSNIGVCWSELVRRFGLYDPFDPCLLSCEIGANKPDRRAYEILLERLELPGEEVVFIDNKKSNVEAAKELGIDAIHFESSDQLRTELNKRGLLKR